MQKWEYMTWVVGHAYTGDPDMTKGWEGGAVKYRNGKLVENWQKGSVLLVALNQAGTEGWELAAIHPGGPDPLYVFKRTRS